MVGRMFINGAWAIPEYLVRSPYVHVAFSILPIYVSTLHHGKETPENTCICLWSTKKGK